MFWIGALLAVMAVALPLFFFGCMMTAKASDQESETVFEQMQREARKADGARHDD